MAIESFLYISSHGLDPLPGLEQRHRFLPRKLQDKFRNQERFVGPEIIAKGGGKLDQEIVSRIIQKAKSLSGTPQLHIVMLGDNNLRHLKQHPDEYLEMIKSLLTALKPIPKCHLVLTSLLPSPPTNWKCAQVFKEVSEEIKKLVGSKDEHSSFLNLKPHFIHGTKIKTNLYLDENDVHLNEDGADVLAQCIFNHLTFLPKKFWL